MVEKSIGKKNGKFHLEVDIELPELKESAVDFVSILKSAAEEVVETGKKILTKIDGTSEKEIKKIKIK